MAEEAEYAMARTSIWWDIENCQVPKDCDAYGITQNISSGLMNMNYYGPLSISSYGNTNLIPKHVQQALSSTGIALNHVPSGRKDASDKRILVDMFLWVVENPAPANLVLISGDSDFSDALHRLRMRRYNILLAHPRQVSVSLVASAKTTWLWRSLLVGGSPLTLYKSSWLVSEISNQDGQEIQEYVPKASNQLLQQETKRKKLQKKCYKIGSAWLCKVCNVACKSFEIFAAHLSGKEHVAQWELKQTFELLGEPQNMDTTSSECHEMNVEFTDKVVKSGTEASTHPENATTMKKQVKVLLDAKNIEESVEDNDLQSRGVEEYMKYLGKQNKEPIKTWTTYERRNGKKFWQVKERLESEVGAPLNVELSRDFRVTKEVKECFDTVLEELEPSNNEIVIEKLESIPKQDMEMKLSELENSSAGLIDNIEGDMNKKKKRKKKKKKSAMIEDGLEAFVCSLRNVTSYCPTVFESHLKGKKHAAMNNKHTKETQLDNNQIQELFETFEEEQENENEPLPNAEWIFAELNPEFSEPRVSFELFQDANVIWELESNSVQVSDKKKKKKLTKDEAYECSICNVICDCPVVLESHLLGRKHSASVKKHAKLVIFEDKKVLEEILQESIKEVCHTPKEQKQNESEELVKCDFDSHLTSKRHTVTVKKHVTLAKKQAGTKIVYVMGIK